MNNATKSITRAAMIAALYTVCTLIFVATSMSTANIQFRVSEALMILPLFMWEAIPGLWIGCMISNLFGGSIIDVFFGSLATLIAAVLTYIIGVSVKNTPLKLIFGVIPPIIVNAIMVPMTFTLFMGEPEAYWLQVLYIFIGQSIMVIGAGIPLFFGLKPFILKLIMADKINRKLMTENLRESLNESLSETPPESLDENQPERLDETPPRGL